MILISLQNSYFPPTLQAEHSPKTLKLKWHFQPCPLTTLHLRRLAVSVPGRKVTSHGSPKALQQSDTDTVKTSCIAGTPRSLRIRRDSRVAGVALFRASDLRVYESRKESRCQDKHGYEGVGISIVDFGHLGYCIYRSTGWKKNELGMRYSFWIAGCAALQHEACRVMLCLCCNAHNS